MFYFFTFLIFCSNVFSMLISRAACLASEKHSDLPSQENETNISNVAILAPSSVQSKRDVLHPER